MLKRIANRILYVFLMLNGIGLVIILANKDSFRETYADLGITLVFDRYWLLNIIFGWPIIIAVVIALMWTTWRQLKKIPVGQKIKWNSIVFLSLFTCSAAWMAQVYWPFYSMAN